MASQIVTFLVELHGAPGVWKVYHARRSAMIPWKFPDLHAAHQADRIIYIDGDEVQVIKDRYAREPTPYKLELL